MSRFEDTEADQIGFVKTLKLYPFVGVGLISAAGVLGGRIAYYMRYGSKHGLEMYVLTTRVFTQGTFVFFIGVPLLYNTGAFVYRKIRGLPTEKALRPLPKDLEYVPDD